MTHKFKSIAEQRMVDEAKLAEHAKTILAGLQSLAKLAHKYGIAVEVSTYTSAWAKGEALTPNTFEISMKRTTTDFDVTIK